MAMLKELMEKLEGYGFTDKHGHPLENCVDFMNLIEALPRTLEWTDEPPKVDLWYWHRIKDRPESASIVKVWPPLLEEPHLGENHQWAGPIPEPRETLNS